MCLTSAFSYRAKYVFMDCRQSNHSFVRRCYFFHNIFLFKFQFPCCSSTFWWSSRSFCSVRKKRRRTFFEAVAPILLPEKNNKTRSLKWRRSRKVFFDETLKLFFERKKVFFLCVSFWTNLAAGVEIREREEKSRLVSVLISFHFISTIYQKWQKKFNSIILFSTFDGETQVKAEKNCRERFLIRRWRYYETNLRYLLRWLCWPNKCKKSSSIRI